MRLFSSTIRSKAIKKVKTSQKGRKCKHPHCMHILSIYNHEVYCHVHLSLGDKEQKSK